MDHINLLNFFFLHNQFGVWVAFFLLKHAQICIPFQGLQSISEGEDFCSIFIHLEIKYTCGSTSLQNLYFHPVCIIYLLQPLARHLNLDVLWAACNSVNVQWNLSCLLKSALISPCSCCHDHSISVSQSFLLTNQRYFCFLPSHLFTIVLAIRSLKWI